jgi:3-phosphoshikimate 1-carboxyvinyltransferase
MSATTASDRLVIQGATAGLAGHIRVPGDKSISHRAVLFGAIAQGTTRIRNFLPANDCIASLQAVRSLGIEVEIVPSDDFGFWILDFGASNPKSKIQNPKSFDVLVHGRGLRGLREPAEPVECGGSGTTMRLLAGLLAGQPFRSVLAGNAQLSRRPMDRVAIPLRRMGATVFGGEDGAGARLIAPLQIVGGNLHGMNYELPVASAQVKSAVLLAGLSASGVTAVVEPVPTRDHTERMLAAMGAPVSREGNIVRISAPTELEPLEVRVPADMSSAAFVLAAAAIVPGSRVVVPGVGINPGRVGILRALRRMGADLRLVSERLENNEPLADLELRYGPLRGIAVTAEEVPGIIDELPALAVVATQAQGTTEVRGAAELRVKETDRIAATVGELRRMGANIEALPDGFIVEGPTRLRAAQVASHGDHRLAMALAVAALAAEGETTVYDAACSDDSFPGFEGVLRMLMGTQA